MKPSLASFGENPHGPDDTEIRYYFYSDLYLCNLGQRPV